MVLRKPYAFLIKYFKLFHIIMFICFGYLVFVLQKIYLFFSSYVKTSNFTYFEDMTSKYIPVLVFFILILLIGFGIGILLLMRKKDKPVLFYKLLITYCVVLLIAFIYFFTFFKSLENTVYPPLRVVINRDISLFLYIVNYFFVAFSFIRGFGFDIKKFSFDKDKKELNLEESDSEEYELNINLEKEDVVNYFNKQKREFKYYLEENSLVLTILGIVLVVGLGIFLYLNIFVYNKVYKEKDDVSIGGVTYVVNSSYITNIDKYGKTLSSNEYVIINLNIINDEVPGYLDKQAFRINTETEYIYPFTSTCDLFDDLGECYKNQQLKANDNHNYIMVFKIKNDVEKLYFEVLKENGSEYKYSKVLLSPQKYGVEKTNYNIGESFKINNNEYKINSYEILEKTSYEYEECINETCNNYTRTVSPSLGDNVLALEFDSIENLTDDFLNRTLGLKYDTKTYFGDELKLIDKYKNTLYFSIPSGVKNTGKLYLIITMRDKCYSISLNGGE